MVASVVKVFQLLIFFSFLFLISFLCRLARKAHQRKEFQPLRRHLKQFPDFIILVANQTLKVSFMNLHQDIISSDLFLDAITETLSKISKAFKEIGKERLTRREMDSITDV